MKRTPTCDFKSTSRSTFSGISGWNHEDGHVEQAEFTNELTTYSTGGYGGWYVTLGREKKDFSSFLWVWVAEEKRKRTS